MKLCLLLFCLFPAFLSGAMQLPFKEQQAAYELTLTVRNINGSARSSALIRLFNANPSTMLAELSTNASGQAIFSDLPEGTYQYEVFYKPPAVISPLDDPTEYWGGGEVTIAGSSQSVVFTRNQPYISREAVFTPVVFQPNQTASAGFTVKNNQASPAESYIALWVDRDKTFSWDLIQEISAKTINPGSTSVFPFSVTPAQTGTYYCYAFVYTNVNGHYLITDQYTWYEVFKVNDLLGNLDVLFSDAGKVGIPQGHQIIRYDLSHQFLDSRLTDNNGMANWAGILEGSYLFESYNTSLNSLWAVDLFEGSKQFTVTAGKTDTVSLIRSEPFIESVKVNGTVYGPGSTVHAEVTVLNPSSDASTCRASIRIDLDRQLSYDFESGFQNSIILQPGQKGIIGFDWTIPADALPGTYSVASCIQTHHNNGWVPTDATNWDALFKIENSTISQIQWSGLTWNVKSGLGLGPGPNDWMANSSIVWVDDQDNLHLKIRKIGTKWYCVSINTKPAFGYGDYTFQVSSNMENLDKNVVLGLFTYENDTREIDIEFSRWGNPLEKAGWYNVQPSGLTSHHTFDLLLKDNYSTHKFQWSASKVAFQSFQGHADYLPEKNKLISEWTYTGIQIPPAGNERIILNLWLFKGMAPSDMKETEVVIRSFSFTKVGDLSIQLKNTDLRQGPLPGSYGIVQLYKADNTLVSTRESDQNGMVLFNGLAAGNGYYYRVYYQPTDTSAPKAKEYWGSKSGIQIVDGQTTTSVFTREQPVNGFIKVFNGTQEVTGQAVEPGIPLRIEQTIVNPSFTEQKAKAMILLDRDSAAPYDFYLQDTSLVSIPARGYVTRTWSIIPLKKGSYYGTATVQTILDKDTITTDVSTWSILPLFSISGPVANFSVNHTSGCSPLTVDFRDLSSSFPGSWAWDMNNDGKVDDTTRYPSYTYTQPGLYSVKLTVANAAGSDSIILTNQIIVYPVLVPEVEINVSPSGTIYEGQPVTFNAVSTNGGLNPTYEWRVDGIAIGNNTSAFTPDKLSDGQKVSCLMSPDAPCAVPGTVSSNVIIMSVKPINKIPVARAGANQTVNEGTLVYLDGTASFDPDQQPLTYLWKAPKGVSLNSQTASKPIFTAPEVNKDTILNFSLTVNDGLISSTESFVQIHVMNVISASVENSNHEGLKVYPNPTTGIFFIEGLKNHAIGEISVYTSNGRLILNKVSHSSSCRVDLSRQAPGTYFLVINNQKIKIIREPF